MSMGRFTGSLEFKQMLEAKKQDIYRRTSDGIQETPQFQRLLTLFKESRRKYSEKDFRLIIISKEDLHALCQDADVKVQYLFRHSDFLTNRTVAVNSELLIVDKNNAAFPADNNDARRYFASLSLNTPDTIVFHIAPNATVNYFISGNDYGNGVFYTLEAQQLYEERKTIEQLSEVLDDYRICLTHQDTYLKFFVDKAGLHALHKLTKSKEGIDNFISGHKHLLRNKPETLFHEDIRNYIKQHMRVVVSKEVVLENQDRLDIELTNEDGNDLYFIEIKWVGESIGPNGDSISTKYDAHPRIQPDAVRQVVGYIDELLKEDKNIKIGYLVVFDARKEDMEDTGADIIESDVPENIRQHFHRFQKLPDFRVKNINPR